MSLVQELNHNIREEQPLHIESAVTVDLDWDKVIPHFQHCADEVKGRPINILSYQIPDADALEEVQLVKDYLNKELDLKILDADFFVSFTKKTKSLDPHKDNHNTLLWNAVGEIAVNIYQDPDEKPIYAKKLGKNDIIFIPHWVHHEIIPLTARATVSFGLETSKKD